jgi:hypothetical protein
MKVIAQAKAAIDSDGNGDLYFNVGETSYYLNEFMLVPHEGQAMGVSHITNTGGIQIVLDELNEEVHYTIFTD